MLLLMVATTLPLVGMLCSAWTVTSTLDDILYSTKIEDVVQFLYLAMFLRFI